MMLFPWEMKSYFPLGVLGTCVLHDHLEAWPGQDTHSTRAAQKQLWLHHPKWRGRKGLGLEEALEEPEEWDSAVPWVRGGGKPTGDRRGTLRTKVGIWKLRRSLDAGARIGRWEVTGMDGTHFFLPLLFSHSLPFSHPATNYNREKPEKNTGVGAGTGAKDFPILFKHC